MGRYVRGGIDIRARGGGGNCHAATRVRHYDCHCLLRSTCMSVHGLQDLLCYGFVFGYSRSPTEGLGSAQARPKQALHDTSYKSSPQSVGGGLLQSFVRPSQPSFAKW